MHTDVSRAGDILDSYRVGNTPLFIVGTYDNGVTVYSQQVRALNLVWAAVETGRFICDPEATPAQEDKPLRIAIVGGGMAGLSIAAGLLKKRATAHVSIFEQRDTLMPLQHGSDSRWLHPRIYDWPGDGSHANVAMLPVLNWTAARASDVVVQILAEWKKVLSEDDVGKRLKLYCNARHLQIHESDGGSGQLDIEWVAEQRSAIDGTLLAGTSTSTKGATESFDAVILAVGFGLERSGALSYWRNDTIGQPSLDQPRRAYIVSGQGDGAMIDLLRIRISQYRQDRILDELFHGKPNLLSRLKELHSRHGEKAEPGLFRSLEELEADPQCHDEFVAVLSELGGRLRRDTDAVLQLLVRKFSDLFDPGNTKISFQNRLLVYLLYKCGGFVPSTQKESQLVRQHSIGAGCIIRRHGTHRDEQLRGMISDPLYSMIEAQRAGPKGRSLSQTERPLWPGGYFGMAGKLASASMTPDAAKAKWRKEYIPGPTSLLAAAFCGALAGALRHDHPGDSRLRVTLHRAVILGEEELLQQCCEYFGSPPPPDKPLTAARTFPAKNATIGQAYMTRRIVRSRRDVPKEKLSEAMKLLDLSNASREMSKMVGFVMAIPIVEPEDPGSYTAPNPVAGVVYIDSEAQDFWIDDAGVARIVRMIKEFVHGLDGGDMDCFPRIRNVLLSGCGDDPPNRSELPPAVSGAIELAALDPPMTSGPFQFNFDHTDFVAARA